MLLEGELVVWAKTFACCFFILLRGSDVAAAVHCAACTIMPRQKVILIMTAFRIQNNLGLSAARKIRTSKYPDQLRTRQYINLLQGVVGPGGGRKRLYGGQNIRKLIVNQQKLTLK